MRDTLSRDNEKRQDALLALLAARVGGLPMPGFAQQPAVFVDQTNRTGLASNSNEGNTRTNPIRNWSEVLRRYGTQDPILPQSTDWHFLSPSPANGSDPVVFGPTMINASTGRFLADYDTPQTVGSGVLAGVVAKNRAAGTLLVANLSSVAGAATNQVIQNTTAGKVSRAIVLRSDGGGVFELSQPMTLGNGVLLGSEVEVNTWADGDTFTLYQPDLIDLVRLEPVVASFNMLSSNFFTLWQMGVLDPTSANNVGSTNLGDTLYLSESVFLRRPVFRPSAWGKNAIVTNVWGNAGIATASPLGLVDGLGSGFFATAGGARGLAAMSKALDADYVCFATCRIMGGLIGSVYVDSFVRIVGQIDFADLGNGVAFYGPGALDVSGGRLFLDGTTAVASLLLAGGLTINGLGTGFTATAAGPSVIDGNVTITPAHIDAAPMGQIWIPGGGAIGTVGD